MNCDGDNSSNKSKNINDSEFFYQVCENFFALLPLSIQCQIMLLAGQAFSIIHIWPFVSKLNVCDRS